MLVPGYITNVTNDACYVRFLGQLTGRAGLAQLADLFVSDPSRHFHVGQSVRAQVVQVRAYRCHLLKADQARAVTNCSELSRCSEAFQSSCCHGERVRLHIILQQACAVIDSSMGLNAHIGVAKSQRPPHVVLLCSITRGKLCFAGALCYSIFSVLRLTSVPHSSMHPAGFSSSDGPACLWPMPCLPACQQSHIWPVVGVPTLCTPLQAAGYSSRCNSSSTNSRVSLPILLPPLSFCCPFCLHFLLPLLPIVLLHLPAHCFAALMSAVVATVRRTSVCRFKPQRGAAIQTDGACMVCAGGHCEGEVHSHPETKPGWSL